MKRLKYILAAVIVSSSLYSVQAQETWSLEKCIEYAKEHNIQLRKQELNAQLSKNNLTQSKVNLLPSLNGSSSHNFSYGRSLDFETNSYINRDQQSTNFRLSSSLDLFEGFQKYNTIKQNKLNLQANLQEVEKAKEDLALNITSYYLNVLFKKELLQVAKDQVKVTKLQINRTKTLVEAGTLPKGTLMEQQAQAAREEVTVVNAQNSLDLALLDLAQLLDLNTTEGFDILIPELPVLNANKSLVDPNSVFISALEFRPEIKAAEYRLESNKKGLSIARGRRSPSLSLDGYWNSGYSNTLKIKDPVTSKMSLMSFKDQLELNESKSFYFTLRIPIFNGGSVNRSISNAKINIDQSKLDLENSKNILRKEIQQAHANALAAMKKFFSSETAVSSTEEAFRYTEEKFNLGLVNSVEYNEARNNLLKSKSDLLQAKYDYIFRTKILDFYNGIEIKL
ncbi:MAG: TolC family protein [Marinifilaceae bacterium]